MDNKEFIFLIYIGLSFLIFIFFSIDYIFYIFEVEKYIFKTQKEIQELKQKNKIFFDLRFVFDGLSNLEKEKLKNVEGLFFRLERVLKMKEDIDYIIYIKKDNKHYYFINEKVLYDIKYINL